ncbi:DUF6348 family protein [Emticicia sp. TH156]|uniref:DUF6348 family protein n=1 Tax=Emticicia sp. TH156 TaxID=2067454 RepID=UPI00286DF910|nr:DUF6348 family protein [Emticicia sp. TH156]
MDNPNNHPNVMQLMILTIHHAYFPDGIEENIVGVGTNIKDKVSSVLDNYINTTFLPIIASLSNRHNPEFNFSVIADEGKEVLWHTTLGNVRLQGEWIDQNQNESFFEIVKDKIKNRLSSDKINWLKVYVSKRADGTIIGECLLNNIPWEEVWADLKKYAESWEMKSDFKA